jgi:hypothetical protein
MNSGLKLNRLRLGCGRMPAFVLHLGHLLPPVCLWVVSAVFAFWSYTCQDWLTQLMPEQPACVWMVFSAVAALVMTGSIAMNYQCMLLCPTYTQRFGFYESPNQGPLVDALLLGPFFSWWAGVIAGVVIAISAQISFPSVVGTKLVTQTILALFVVAMAFLHTDGERLRLRFYDPSEMFDAMLHRNCQAYWFVFLTAIASLAAAPLIGQLAKGLLRQHGGSFVQLGEENSNATLPGQSFPTYAL